MRFVLGLMCGVAAVVVVMADPAAWPAAVAGAARELVDRHEGATAAGTVAAGRLAAGAAADGQSTGETVQPPDEFSGPPAADPVVPAAADASLAPPRDAPAWPAPAALPQAFDEDYAWWAVSASASEPTDDSVSADRVAATVAPPGGVDEGRVDGAVPLPATRITAADLARVWIPFHSERSAAGFADRLSRALAHPFSVRRQGPGSYEVVFPYEDPVQRDVLLTRVAALTGLQP